MSDDPSDLKPLVVPTRKPRTYRKDDCCEQEENYFEDDSEDVICRSRKEHACPVKCRVCGEEIFQSNCCT